MNTLNFLDANAKDGLVKKGAAAAFFSREYKLGVDMPWVPNDKNRTPRKAVAHCVSLVSSASIDSMATITIRQLDEKTKTRLRVRAAHHGRSMEEEAREILRSALRASPAGKQNLSEAVRRRFAEFGGLELELPPRDAAREAPKFGE
jgi:plasmid stability protein